jgi:hypothetical protein
MDTSVVSEKIRLGLKVLLIAGILGLITGRPLLGQSSGGSPPTPPASGGPTDPQKRADRNASGVSDPVPPPSTGPAGTPSAPAGNPSQPFNVNPLTGLASVSATNYHPLTGEERWKLYWKQNYASAGAYVGPFVTALLLDQTSNTPAAWGGGFEGFGKRLGSRVATAVLQGTFQASLAAALHEDVRYIASGQKKGFKQRVRHAIMFSFLTYNNQGHTTLNISNLTSYYAATAVSTAWIPIGESKARYTLLNGTEQVGLSIPTNMVQEFWPEIVHKVFRRP